MLGILCNLVAFADAFRPRGNGRRYPLSQMQRWERIVPESESLLISQHVRNTEIEVYTSTNKSGLSQTCTPQ